jgi:hypothetical protein
MEYLFASENTNYADLASGHVFTTCRGIRHSRFAWQGKFTSVA